jgi:hypothetical protein
MVREGVVFYEVTTPSLFGPSTPLHQRSGTIGLTDTPDRIAIMGIFAYIVWFTWRPGTRITVRGTTDYGRPF